ncbi:hypothetical protein G6L37_03600 [Agrobacterium rubi]|nr:hypothetical protein [Agrobacterium rubi]NTF24449.1 hypothetical protein [Agrobacterium rubi]
MRKFLKAALLSASIAAASVTSASAGELLDKAISFVGELEAATGTKIAILERMERTEEFWARSAAILCQKTGDNWCSNDVMFMTANTEPSGQSQILQYIPEGTSTTKIVCALIPPMPNIDPSFVGEAYGTMYQTATQYPGRDEMAAWLVLYHAAHCLDTTATRKSEERAAAFATLGLGLMQGGHGFVPGLHRVAARRIAVMTQLDEAYWAAGTAERILLDHWKSQVASILRNRYGCSVTVTQSTSIDIENIRRDSALPVGMDCSAPSETSSGGARTILTDANLWIWMYGEGGLGAPPVPYGQFAAVGGANVTTARYILETANDLSGN